MRKVMPGCFLGWNRVGFLARAIGFNGGVGYGGKVPQKVEKKNGFGGVFRNVGKKVLGVPGCRGLAGKNDCSRWWTIWDGRDSTQLGSDDEGGELYVITGRKIGSTRV